MTATSPALLARRLAAISDWAAPLAIALGLGGIVGARLVATRTGLDPLLVGAAFGAALTGLAVGTGARAAPGIPVAWAGRARRATPALLLGAMVGLGLVAATVLGPVIGGAPSVGGLGRPAAPFLPWAVITIVVVTAEEGVLRGVLLDRIAQAAGLVPAIVLTTLAFALMHVPLYGWHVVPLDLAVGLVLVGLRISSRSLVAPVAAHAVADLATWWL